MCPDDGGRSDGAGAAGGYELVPRQGCLLNEEWQVALERVRPVFAFECRNPKGEQRDTGSLHLRP
ncbi:hypothetical protein EMEDMD4_430016 [Sinorhizobium medicae]|uniref:Uncharacterized protein n=1 Tax=Sinorhizobium medicae TaxID=110321 RepID=A0A508WYW0_9HYPH|nr:hypothetical protein EMEDMD4_430016 [Sinorhizobium medicae]